MITLVDTNVLLDVLLPDPVWGRKSAEALERVFQEGAIAINEIIYAELVPQFSDKTLLDRVLKQLGMTTLFMDRETAFRAGMAWKEYRSGGGKRNRILADFLIGAHAEVHAERLLTRDRGFYKRHFSSLAVVYA